MDCEQQLSKSTLKTWVRRKTDPPTVRENLSVSVRAFAPLTPDQKGRELTLSGRNNWNRRANKPRDPGDVGGPFYNEKRSITVVNPTNRRISGRIQWSQSPSYWAEAEYYGPILAFPPGSAVYPTSAKSSKTDLERMGSVAIAKCKPTNAVADVATFLAELYKEKLPRTVGSSLWKEKTLSGREAGDEYLNVEFGWKPMIADIQDIVQGVRHAHDVLAQYERASGSFVRRRFSFPTSYSEVTYPGTSNDFVLLDNAIELRDPSKAPAQYFRREQITKSIWFSGAFTYQLPSGFKSRNKLEELRAKADALLGVNLTPEVLWNLAPWSWAVDWFSNAGDVISNLSDWATDGLVMKYGYVMEHCSARNTYYQDSTGKMFAPTFLGSPVVASVETKQRIVATPFGFGLDWDKLSPRQWSIITSLGLTRGKW